FTIAIADTDAVLDSVELSPPADYLQLTVAPSKDQADGKAWTGNVHVQATQLDAQTKQILSKVIAHLSTAQGPRTFEVPVAGAIEEIVGAMPECIYWKWDASERKQSIQFTAHDGKPLAIRTLACGQQGLVGSEVVPGSNPPSIRIWQKAHLSEGRILRASVVANL